MCIYEDSLYKHEIPDEEMGHKDPENTSESSTQVTISIVAVQTSTGDILYDTFKDGFMRSELGTPSLHKALNSNFNYFCRDTFVSH